MVFCLNNSSHTVIILRVLFQYNKTFYVTTVACRCGWRREHNFLLTKMRDTIIAQRMTMMCSNALTPFLRDTIVDSFAR